jgi:hypothetical protein
METLDCYIFQTDMLIRVNVRLLQNTKSPADMCKHRVIQYPNTFADMCKGHSPAKLCRYQIAVGCKLCWIVVHGTNEALSAGLRFVSQLGEDAIQPRQQRTVERVIIRQQERG